MYPTALRPASLATLLLALSVPASAAEPSSRLEKDLLGEKSVPADALDAIELACRPYGTASTTTSSPSTGTRGAPAPRRT